MSGFPFFKSFKGFRLSRTDGELELQDVFLDKLVVQQEIESDQYLDRRLEVPLSRWLLLGLFAAFVLIIVLFLGKTFHLQAFAGQELQELAQANAIRQEPLPSERGVLYDQFGNQLVFNKPSFDLVCDKRDLPEDRVEKENILRKAADLLGLSFFELRHEFDKTHSPKFLVAENLSHEQLVVLETQMEELTGCQIEKNTIREYVAGTTLAHLLGYTAKISPDELRQFPEYSITEQIGKTGVEKAYETDLRGIPGKILTEKDALGNVVKEQGEIPSEPGNSLVLWLDLELQKKMEEALQATLDRLGAKKAAGVALDPNTGGVLSLVSFPGFDNNLFSKGITQQEYTNIIENPLNPLFNRAIAGTYPTGSTIKPLVGMAALEEDLIDPDKQILTHGYIEIPNQYDPEIVYRFNDNANHGAVNMKEALAVSSNVYFYTIGGGFEDQKGLGPVRIKQYLEKFGWGSKTGIDISGEGAGLIPDPAWKQRVKGEGWWDGDTYNFSIGQGNLLVTPLQVVASFVPIANGGTMYKPKTVKEVLVANPQEGEKSRRIEPEVVKQDFVQPENLEVIREGMRQSVKWGSSVLMNQLPVSSAVKTGTAQTGRKDAEGHDLLYSWVTVFAPYENPEIVMTLMVEEGKEGSLVVLPVAKEVLEWYFTR